MYQPPEPPRDIEGAAGPLLGNIRPTARVYNFYAPRDDDLLEPAQGGGGEGGAV